MRYVPATKAARLELVEAQIKSKTEKGYTLETYKGLKILVKFEHEMFYLTIYKDAAAHPTANYYYRKEENRTKAIEEAKSNYDRHLEYKAKEKANPTVSTAANCAAAIREELKKEFPGIKFSVTSETFAGGNSVRIGWADGPLSDDVEKITDKYQYGQFNGMEDLYEYTNSRDDIPQAKYVSTSRKMSEETRAIIEASAEELYQENPEEFAHYERSGCATSGNFAYRVFQHSPIPTGAKVLGIKRNEETSGVCQPEQFYYIAYELANAPQTKNTKAAAPQIEKTEVAPGTVQIIEYGKGIAVIGETKPIKDILGRQGLGGIFNARLSCGPGWVFPKSKLEEVQKRLSEIKGKAEEPKTEPVIKALPQSTTLKDEIQKTVEFFAETDKNIHGFVTEQTQEIARIQKVKLPGDVKQYDNLQDLERAAHSGQVIDLMNLHRLVNRRI